MFIGRKEELKFLEEAYTSGHSELIILYGRRRIGKTETLQQFAADKKHVFYSCIQNNNETQLRLFSQQILRSNHPFSSFMQTFEDWEAALKAITLLPYGPDKKLVIIDEFPYLCRSNPAFPSTLQNLWDRQLKEENIMLVLCGSSMSFIEKDFLAHKNPMYGRATGILKMKPMSFADACMFFPEYSERNLVLAYSILGGIPHYLKQFNPEISLAENIKSQILRSGTILFSETDFLLKEELREPMIYNAVITAIAAGASRLGEIKDRAMISSTGLTSTYLNNLMELGIVQKVFSVSTGEKERSNKQRGIYRIEDRYFDFWYSFCHPNSSSLESGLSNELYDLLIAPQLNQFAGPTFEDIAMEYLWRLNKKGELPFTFFQIGRWMGKAAIRDPKEERGFRVDETEIDLFAENLDHRQVLAGECKFKDSVFRYSEYLNFREKAEYLCKSRTCHSYLFSLSGFDERLKELADTDPLLHLITLEEMILEFKSVK